MKKKVIVNPSAANEFSMDATASAILSVLDGIFILYRNKVLKVLVIEIGFNWGFNWAPIESLNLQTG